MVCLSCRFQDPREWVAYAGTTYLSGAEASTVRARVARIIPHPSYNPDTADFDVAVLQLDGPLPFGRHVQPVCLPAATHVFPARRKCLISGWGYLREDFRKSPPSRVQCLRAPPPRGVCSPGHAGPRLQPGPNRAVRPVTVPAQTGTRCLFLVCSLPRGLHFCAF